jgi:hypothetical protein
MFKKTLICVLIALVTVSGLYAQALSTTEVAPIRRTTTSFSFASDDNHNGPTFRGRAGRTIESKAAVDLMVDINGDNDGGLVTFQSVCVVKAELYDHSVISVDNNWLHIWKVGGEITFYHRSNNPYNPLLSIRFKKGVLTSYSPYWYTIGETMTLENSARVDASIQMIPGARLLKMGVTQSNLAWSEDVALTFTNVRTIHSKPVEVDREGALLWNWLSEGSFSASAIFWPVAPTEAELY